MTDKTDECLPLQDFDREFILEELLAGINRSKLHHTLLQMLGTSVWITSAAGDSVVGEPQEKEVEHLPIRVQMDVVGYLHVPHECHRQARPAVTFLEMLLHGSVRYLMTSSLHLQAVNEDHEKLKEKHNALLESEHRYRQLSQDLERRVAEQVKTIEATQQQLYQAEKLASVGQLAAGVAHEINNPTGFIKSNLVTAKSYVNDIGALVRLLKSTDITDEIQGYLHDKDLDFVIEDFQTLLDESISGAERISAIVRDLKGFSNIDGDADEIADLNEIIQDACKVIARELGDNSRLRLQLGELPPIACRPADFGRVFLNLLENSVKAIDQSGRILVESGHENDILNVKITDTGVGIPDEIINRIFDPFFTTRGVGKGTGIGLTVARNVVKSHGGEIHASSEPGKGTVVTVSLPINRPTKDH